MKNISRTPALSGAVDGAGSGLQENLPQGATGRKPLLVALVAAFALAVLSGYLAAVYSVTPVLLLISGAVLVWSIIRWPRWGIVLIITFMSTILAPEFFYSIANPKLIYYSQEILLLLIVVSSLIYWVQNHKEAGIFQRLYSSPVMIALTIFLVVVLIKAMAVIIESRFAFSSVSSMYDFNRGITFFLLTIPALLLLDNRERLRWMTRVLFFLGTVVIVRVLLELIFPKWGIWQYGTVAQPLAIETPTVDLSVQRLRTPGGTIMLACFWTGVMSIILQPWTVKRLAFYLPFTLAMLAGMILEFNRSYILPMAVLLVLSTLLNRKNARIKLLALAAVALLVVVMIAAFTGSMQKYIDAASLRFGSALSSQALESQSVTSRRIEQDYAFKAIARAPLFGISLVELYRPPVPGMMDNLRWYIHNSYLWFWTYFGLVGLAAFLGMIFTAIFRSAVNWKRTKDPLLQAVLLGLAFSLATLLAANFAAPKFYDYSTVPMVALMLGMIEAIILSERHGDPALQ